MRKLQRKVTKYGQSAKHILFALSIVVDEETTNFGLVRSIKNNIQGI